MKLHLGMLSSSQDLYRGGRPPAGSEQLSLLVMILQGGMLEYDSVAKQ